MVICLPSDFIERAGITETSQVEVSTTDNGLVITHATSKEARRHIPLSERLKGWNGKPYELLEEDREWLNMESVGDEVEV